MQIKTDHHRFGSFFLNVNGFQKVAVQSVYIFQTSLGNLIINYKVKLVKRKIKMKQKIEYHKLEKILK